MKGYLKLSSKLSAILVVSDTHVGSKQGLWPDGFVSASGNTLGSNPFQKRMGALWHHAVEQALARLKGRDFLLALNGDAVEGVFQHKSIEFMSPDPADQNDAAEQIFKPLATEAKEVLGTYGTECHSKQDEVALYKKLGGAPVIDNPRMFAHNKARFHVRGCPVDMTHHMTCTGRSYLEASGMGIMMGNARLNCARDGLQVPKVFIRGHRHVPGYFCDARGLFVVLGAWQGLTRHGYKAVPDSVPYPTLAILDWKDKPMGALPAVEFFGGPMVQDGLDR